MLFPTSNRNIKYCSSQQIRLIHGQQDERQKDKTGKESIQKQNIAAKDFTALIPELQDYLRVRLKNSKVVMTVRVSAPTETVRAVGRVEKFQMMSQKNQALMQLKEEFGLELY